MTCEPLLSRIELYCEAKKPTSHHVPQSLLREAYLEIKGLRKALNQRDGRISAALASLKWIEPHHNEDQVDVAISESIRRLESQEPYCSIGCVCAECERVSAVRQGLQVRHIKSGGHYAIRGHAELQSSSGPVDEKAVLTVYEGSNGKWWVRPATEFEEKFVTEETYQALKGATDAE